MNERTRILILGAGGRDFHVFNTCYRDDASHEVVAFTAAQIPDIDDRLYPPVLSGPLYPEGVSIVPEERLEELIRDRAVAEAVFSYSDVSLEYVDGMRRRVEAAGARFSLFDPDRTMLKSSRPCVAICAVRTGCGKSQTSRHVVATLRDLGLRPGILRHPMPYGQLEQQVVQRFASIADLEEQHCTIEEMEEYEPHIAAGSVVFAGADYQRILEAAEAESDVIVWDGGNNDTPFVRPDLWITLADPLRPGHERSHFPGHWNFERAGVIVINKIDQAEPADLEAVRASARELNPGAHVVEARSPVTLADEAAVRGKRALVVEDGPTATHGGMGYGAGFVAAKAAGAEIVDPRPYLAGRLAAAFEKYPHLESVVPALGYGEQEIADLEATINAADCDVVVIGTPIDLTRIVKLNKPAVRATYRYEEASKPGLAGLVRERFAP